MDRRERYEDLQEAVRAAMDGRQSEIWTALPGIILSYDAAEGTVSVQPALKGAIQTPDGSLVDVTMDKLIHVPVHFPSGGGYTLTMPVKKGDECLVVFSSRCIDTWWDKGGVQPQAEIRKHDLSDGFAILGTRSKVRALKGASTDTVQLRTDDGKTYVEIAGGSGAAGTTGTFAATGSKGGSIHLVTEADVTITAKGKITINASGDVAITASGNVVLGGGSKGVARIGDTVECPAGTGHITTGAAKVLA
jgi:hypothetical protein